MFEIRMGIKCPRVEDFLLKEKFDFSIFDELVPHEALDNLETFEYFSKNILNNLYVAVFNDETCKFDYRMNMSYEKLKRDHFGGDFNKNPLLEMMILEFAPDNVDPELTRKYFPGKMSNSLGNGYEFAKELTKLLREGNQNPESEEFLHIEDINKNHIRESTMKFFESKKLKFSIDDFELTKPPIRFFRTLERFGYPEETLKSITKLQNIEKRLKNADRVRREFLERLSKDDPERYLKIRMKIVEIATKLEKEKRFSFHIDRIDFY
jgi:hypothetical protein